MYISQLIFSIPLHTLDLGPWTVTDTTTDTDHGVVNFAVTSVTLELKFSTRKSQVIFISTMFNL